MVWGGGGIVPLVNVINQFWREEKRKRISDVHEGVPRREKTNPVKREMCLLRKRLRQLPVLTPLVDHGTGS